MPAVNVSRVIDGLTMHHPGGGGHGHDGAADVFAGGRLGERERGGDYVPLNHPLQPLSQVEHERADEEEQQLAHRLATTVSFSPQTTEKPPKYS